MRRRQARQRWGGFTGAPPTRRDARRPARNRVGARAETGAGFTARAAQVALQRLRWYLATTGGARGRPAPPHARAHRPSILLLDTEKLRAGVRSLGGFTFAPPPAPRPPPSNQRRTRITENGPKRPSTALGVAPGMIPPPRRGRCAGRGQAQQSLPACRYSGHGSPLPRMVARRAHLLDSCPPVRGSHHGAPLGDEATAQQSGSPRTWLHRVPAHFAQQATAATLGDGRAPGRGGRRGRSGRRARGTRRRSHRRAAAFRVGAYQP